MRMQLQSSSSLIIMRAPGAGAAGADALVWSTSHDRDVAIMGGYRYRGRSPPPPGPAARTLRAPGVRARSGTRVRASLTLRTPRILLLAHAPPASRGRQTRGHARWQAQRRALQRQGRRLRCTHEPRRLQWLRSAAQRHYCCRCRCSHRSCPLRLSLGARLRPGGDAFKRRWSGRQRWQGGSTVVELRGTSRARRHAAAATATALSAATAG